MRYFYLCLAVFLAASIPTVSHAQFDANGRRIAEVEVEPMTLEQILPEVNKSSVLSNGKYVSAKTLLGRRVRDSQTKLAGEVSDVYVASGGSVSAVKTVFSRLHLNGTVALNPEMDGLMGMLDGYKMGLSSDEIKSVFPELMSRTKQTPPEQNGFSIKKLVGADVSSAGGEDIGKLKEILFDAKGEHADLAYLVITYGPFKQRPVIVPFGIIDIQTKRDRPVLVISNEDLETVFKFLTSKQK